ncbi:hypothetical protein PQ455_10395 [Sphingomonas naphthae]|uniref:Uncharacterized protein n=1 Tax=Sphingomonas naphthae TaxID=1813468 RepID=A0ABY7TH75_9SPHN|nr:hypothetical protein [Sphingomonas naphthae]WCT72057.1 hypothetical protein PQ455_10395 [Sphingomonas naphthae]
MISFIIHLWLGGIIAFYGELLLIGKPEEKADPAVLAGIAIWPIGMAMCAFDRTRR